MSSDPILPGATLGVLGSGQLGRMLALEARKMGYRVHVLSPGTDTPTGQVADLEVSAPYDDLDAVAAFARRVDAVTFEFENVPSATARACAEHTRVRPTGSVLHVAQNRLREKTFFADNGFPVAPFRRVTGTGDLDVAVADVGTPAVLKTAGFGYDGKGQEVVESPGDAGAAWERLQAGMGQGHEAILEAFVDFELEVSVVGARGADGTFAHYGVMANDHADHILDLTVAPAPVPPEVAGEAVRIARGVFEALEVVGVLCVEMFVTGDGGVLVNEIAPRPHNSGHLTFGGAVSSQFEQQARAVLGLPLGSTELLRPGAAMANLLGDLWAGGEPPWERALAHPTVKLHLYGKADARPGRKMGHLTALADTPEEARKAVLAARRDLGGDP